jgi:acyl carrier protein
LGGAGTTAEGERGKLDIIDLLAHQPLETVQKIVTDLIVEEIGRVLRLPREEVSKVKPLAEIGLDSLMAVELALGLEERFQLEASLSTSASGLSVKDLADHIISLASGALPEDQQIAKSLADKHNIDATSKSAEKAQIISQSIKDILN